ncbi:MAG TPA: ATP-binding protein [Acidimicrobiales bacterium]|nr:ATP-binding protein [Acidimicrobiales bacterium]
MGQRKVATFESAPASVRAAREFVGDALDAWHLDRVRDVASLCTSEVATNAVRHAGTPFRLTVEARASEVVIEVEDRDEDEPVSRLPDLDAESGRGLWMVTAMASRWGYQKVHHGKVVWFSLSLS